MTKVDIYKLEKGGTQNVVATCFLQENGTVEIVGDKNIKESLCLDGIRSYEAGLPKTLYPKDGKVFLSQLRFNFKSGYLSATAVLDE